MIDKQEIKNYINAISLYKLTESEEELIDETINNFTNKRDLIRLVVAMDLDYIKNCNFNDFSPKTVGIFLYELNTIQREIDIVNFTYRVLTKEIEIKKAS